MVILTLNAECFPGLDRLRPTETRNLSAHKKTKDLNANFSRANFCKSNIIPFSLYQSMFNIFDRFTHPKFKLSPYTYQTFFQNKKNIHYILFIILL